MRKTVAAVVVLFVVTGCGGSDRQSSAASALTTTSLSGIPEATLSTERGNLSEGAEPATSTASTESDTTEQPPETTVPVQDVVADSAAAQTALLTLEDFPVGWSEVPREDDDSNEALLERVYECLGPEAAGLFKSEAKVESGNFTNTDDAERINHSVVLAPTEDIAAAYIISGSSDGVTECLTTVYREELGKLAEENEDSSPAEMGEVTVGQLNVGQIGDDRFAYRITVPFSANGFTLNVVADFVAIRVGRSTAGLNFQSTFEPTSIDRIVEFATIAASRLPG
jgi:hypothetical protein